MNLKTERDKALKHAYSFAKRGNFTWAQLWINRASDFLPVTTRQLAYANKLLKQYNERNKQNDNR